MLFVGILMVSVTFKYVIVATSSVDRINKVDIWTKEIPATEKQWVKYSSVARISQ